MSDPGATDVDPVHALLDGQSVDLGDVEPARSRHAGRRSAVALLDDLVVVGLADGRTVALDRASLDERWRWPEGVSEDGDDSSDDEGGASVVAAAPFADGVAVGTRGRRGEIRFHDASSGEVRWRYEAADDVGEPQRDTRFFLPFVADLQQHVDRLYAAVRRYERTPGGGGSEEEPSDGDDDSETSSTDGDASSERSFESVVYAFAPDGTVVWTDETDASPISLDCRDDRVAVAYNRCPGSFQHGLVVLDAVDGTDRWHWDPGTAGQRRVGDVSLVPDGALVASHGDFRGYCLADGGAERWRVDLATPERIGEETLYAYPNHVHATDDGAVFVTGNTYAEAGRETDSLHPEEHTAIAVDPGGRRRWTADVGGFASGAAADGGALAVPGAQHFRTRDAAVHGLRLLDVRRGVRRDVTAEGVVTAAAIDERGLAAVEEPVAYHDRDEVLGAYRLHCFER